MFLIKPPYLPQTKINYLGSFSQFFAYCLYLWRYFIFFKTSTFHNEADYILHHNTRISTNYMAIWKAKMLFRCTIDLAEKATLNPRAFLVLQNGLILLRWKAKQS